MLPSVRAWCAGGKQAEEEGPWEMRSLGWQGKESSRELYNGESDSKSSFPGAL